VNDWIEKKEGKRSHFYSRHARNESFGFNMGGQYSLVLQQLLNAKDVKNISLENWSLTGLQTEESDQRHPDIGSDVGNSSYQI